MTHYEHGPGCTLGLDGKQCDACKQAYGTRDDGWRKAAVGCYWSRGEYAIATYQRGDEHGYMLVKNRQTVGEYKTFEEAEQHAK